MADIHRSLTVAAPFGSPGSSRAGMAYNEDIQVLIFFFCACYDDLTESGRITGDDNERATDAMA
jgi:hypothetical protein